ncbi:MAG: hypothetical protein KME54_09990 [Tolypothrix brevis GSE-NOS-MK-07-07A]|jgi:hypothetical protein|uniref:Uncharacterized protein n=1 Tax=Scytonema hofmannii FACHB-248 TaxID=1842502 RepID=A0ABR8GK01_9CYAN|nr:MULTISPECIES: hypothetical protein [Nostocales]MBD2603717.1 hypothetical protein [Scytonema hofmannii FACHB-248]MBW4477190.1 hypothetical protein [Tolypothrix brevis GSE-NOS-MK-07-07A]MBW4568491.1 hypothetical protein [Tolypothrix carrinoi HA7290-LM1]
MSNTNYQQLTEIELRNYIKQHPEDEDAFQHYLAIMRAKPGRVVVSTEEQAVIEFQKRIQAESKHQP